MSRMQHAVRWSLFAALIGMSMPASAAPTGLAVTKGEATKSVTLVHGRYRGGYGPRVFIGPTRAWGYGYPHRHIGYPYFAYYGGYYPSGYVDYEYGYDESCYYSRRYRARVCPDW